MVVSPSSVDGKSTPCVCILISSEIDCTGSEFEFFATIFTFNFSASSGTSRDNTIGFPVIVCVDGATPSILKSVVTSTEDTSAPIAGINVNLNVSPTIIPRPVSEYFIFRPVSLSASLSISYF